MLLALIGWVADKLQELIHHHKLLHMPVSLLTVSMLLELL
jgi:hypothetical protein